MMLRVVAELLVSTLLIHELVIGHEIEVSHLPFVFSCVLTGVFNIMIQLFYRASGGVVTVTFNVGLLPRG
jgi:hypothetical protein